MNIQEILEIVGDKHVPFLDYGAYSMLVQSNKMIVILPLDHEYSYIHSVGSKDDVMLVVDYYAKLRERSKAIADNIKDAYVLDNDYPELMAKCICTFMSPLLDTTIYVDDDCENNTNITIMANGEHLTELYSQFDVNHTEWVVMGLLHALIHQHGIGGTPIDANILSCVQHTDKTLADIAIVDKEVE